MPLHQHMLLHNVVSRLQNGRTSPSKPSSERIRYALKQTRRSSPKTQNHPMAKYISSFDGLRYTFICPKYPPYTFV